MIRQSRKFETLRVLGQVSEDLMRGAIFLLSTRRAFADLFGLLRFDWRLSSDNRAVTGIVVGRRNATRRRLRGIRTRAGVRFGR